MICDLCGKMPDVEVRPTAKECSRVSLPTAYFRYRRHLSFNTDGLLWLRHKNYRRRIYCYRAFTAFAAGSAATALSTPSEPACFFPGEVPLLRGENVSTNLIRALNDRRRRRRMISLPTTYCVYGRYNIVNGGTFSLPTAFHHCRRAYCRCRRHIAVPDSMLWLPTAYCRYRRHIAVSNSINIVVTDGTLPLLTAYFRCRRYTIVTDGILSIPTMHATVRVRVALILFMRLLK